MSLTRRAFFISTICSTMAFNRGSVNADTEQANNFSKYTITDPDAGYFDVQKRRIFINRSTNPIFAQLKSNFPDVPTLKELHSIPVPAGAFSIPSFYEDNKAWAKAVRPFVAIEDAVSKFAAAHVINTDPRQSKHQFANYLFEILIKWANKNAMFGFEYSPKSQQAWFQVEGTLFAISLALSIFRADIPERRKELAVIENWLEALAQKHFSIPGGPSSCCNNHYYRRALYATSIGIMADNNTMFRNGVAAIYSALAHAKPDGALPLEIARGPRATHYQNYALMYLVMIAELIERQGYSVWQLEVEGKSLHTLIEFNNKLISRPEFAAEYSGGYEQITKFTDAQYLAWFEIYLSRFENSFMEKMIAHLRPLYNRSLGGHLTVYFYNG